LVGLITTDGCLSSDGRHIDITSKDSEFLETIKKSTGISNKICAKYNGQKQRYFHIVIGNRNFYDFLLSVGLTQRKSLTLGALMIPDKYFIDFFRGLIDGDGCIRRWRHPSNGREQWSMRIYSGSRNFLAWLVKPVKKLLLVKGRIHSQNEESTCFVLKFGKMAARIIAKECYYQGCLGLERKIKLARECCLSSVGWQRSKTALN